MGSGSVLAGLGSGWGRRGNGNACQCADRCWLGLSSFAALLPPPPRPPLFRRTEPQTPNKQVADFAERMRAAEVEKAGLEAEIHVGIHWVGPGRGGGGADAGRALLE